MMNSKNITIHRPPHIYLDNKIYFITAQTLKKRQIFNSEAKMRSFASLLQKNIIKYDFSLYAWVLLENHYHLLFGIKTSDNLKKFIRKLHSDTAIELNSIDGISRRKVWYQYWDRCIRSEKDFWTRFNYIHNNPIKHGYIKNSDGLEKYKFSSYGQWIKKNGEEWMALCFAAHPIIDFSLPDD